MGPSLISLIFNVLLKNQKENNLPTFFNYRQLQKRGWFSKHLLPFMKSDETVNLVVALRSILVPSD